MKTRSRSLEAEGGLQICDLDKIATVANVNKNNLAKSGAAKMTKSTKRKAKGTVRGSKDKTVILKLQTAEEETPYEKL